MSVLDYAMMVGDSYVDTKVFEYRFRGPDTAINGRGEGPLIATALTDVLATACRWSTPSSTRLCRPQPRHLHDPRPIARARRMACLTSISAIGSRVRADGLQAPLPPAGASRRQGLGKGGLASSADCERPQAATRYNSSHAGTDRRDIQRGSRLSRPTGHGRRSACDDHHASDGAASIGRNDPIVER